MLPSEHFAANLFRAAVPVTGNFVFSPRSVADLLGLLSLGACGETCETIWETLSFDDPGEMDRALAAADAAVREAGHPGARCETDTALWIREGLSLRAEFRENARRVYGAEVAEIAMDETGRRTINAHVSRATHGMIPELLAEPPDGELVATNAVWFKGSWNLPFSPELTRPGVFYSPHGKLRVPFMHRTEWFSVAESCDFEAVRLYYLGGHFALDVFLPRPGVPVAKIECKFEKALAQTRESFPNGDNVFLSLALPKCDIAFARNLEMPLRRLGAGRIFAPERADFSDIIADDEPFFVSRVIHETHLRIDEEGTEAAAATAMVCPAGCVPPPRPRPFRVNRPFLFALRLCETGDVLFCGRIENPAS